MKYLQNIRNEKYVLKIWRIHEMILYRSFIQCLRLSPSHLVSCFVVFFFVVVVAFFICIQTAMQNVFF